MYKIDRRGGGKSFTRTDPKYDKIEGKTFINFVLMLVIKFLTNK